MPKTLEGQMNFQDLNKIYRKECLLVKGSPCNIFWAHEVAVECGVDCKYGCCNSCDKNTECGAYCNNMKHKYDYKI